ncbi:MAG: DNA mismatch repair endonuclease MutL [Flavobacteriales bacterium]
MSDIIQLLPDHVANQIAAGEVIQRPASAVKELIENSVDSRATSIKLIIKDAGRTLIQVVDNGSGMSETDARMCFERHATSKIKEADDLFSIKSMGFRGEAMASIAAISQVDLKTKTKNTELGTFISIEGSQLKTQENCATNNGTSISIKNLFFNVPARRNFLKSDNVELKHIIEEFTRVCLANPQISFTFHHNDNEVFNLQKSNLRQRISSVMGRNYNEKLVPINEETTFTTISGFIGKPEFARKTRGEQYFFVNNRFIKSGYLHHAIISAYQDLIPKEQIPSYFLFFEIDPTLIDINIHPTKTEIKFEDEKSIYAILRSSTKHALGQHNITPSLDFNRDPAFDTTAPKDVNLKIPTINVDNTYNPFEKKSAPTQSKNNNENWEKLFELNHEEEEKINKNKIVQSSLETNEDYIQKSLIQIQDKYILSPIKSGLMVIHQQRAHQKILFNKYIQFEEKIDSQQLLFPQTIELSSQDFSLAKEITDELNESGFIFDFLGKSSLVFLGIPSDLDQENLRESFDEILEEFKNSANSSLKNNEKMAKALAVSSSIKSGRKLNQLEMSSLIDQLFEIEMPKNGIHKKSTFITISIDEIANKF